MPFVKQNPRPFTEEEVSELKTGLIAVYGLFKSNTWVYVGRGDIRQRLLDHLGGDNACINHENPTHWIAEVTSDADRREKELILELSPICNQRVG